MRRGAVELFVVSPGRVCAVRCLATKPAATSRALDTADASPPAPADSAALAAAAMAKAAVRRRATGDEPIPRSSLRYAAPDGSNAADGMIDALSALSAEGDDQGDDCVEGPERRGPSYYHRLARGRDFIRADRLDSYDKVEKVEKERLSAEELGDMAPAELSLHLRSQGGDAAVFDSMGIGAGNQVGAWKPKPNDPSVARSEAEGPLELEQHATGYGGQVRVLARLRCRLLARRLAHLLAHLLALRGMTRMHTRE